MSNFTNSYTNHSTIFLSINSGSPKNLFTALVVSKVLLNSLPAGLGFQWEISTILVQIILWFSCTTTRFPEQLFYNPCDCLQSTLTDKVLLTNWPSGLGFQWIISTILTQITQLCPVRHQGSLDNPFTAPVSDFTVPWLTRACLRVCQLDLKGSLRVHPSPLASAKCHFWCHAVMETTSSSCWGCSGCYSSVVELLVWSYRPHCGDTGSQHDTTSIAGAQSYWHWPTGTLEHGVLHWVMHLTHSNWAASGALCHKKQDYSCCSHWPRSHLVVMAWTMPRRQPDSLPRKWKLNSSRRRTNGD